MERSYFQIQLDSAIKETEKLLKKLNAVKTDYADKRIEEALEKSVTADKISESVTIKIRALPAFTDNPRLDAMIQEALEEAIPIELDFTEEGRFYLRMHILLPRKEKSSRSYLRGFMYPAFEKFIHGKPKSRYWNGVLIFRHVYDRNRPEREYRDHDNIELNTVVNAIAMFFLVDDTPLECRHYYCSAAGDEERTEVYIVPRADFESWFAMEKEPEKLRKKLHENLPQTAKNDT